MLLAQKRIPDIGRRWACWSLVERRAGLQADAGRSLLRAAWACDDAKKGEWAEVFRNRALDAFQAVQDAGGVFAENRAVEELILVDLLRRNGLFVSASHRLQGLKPADAEGDFDQVAQFQLALIARRDRRVYTFADAQSYAGCPEDWKPAPAKTPWWRRFRRSR